MKVEAELEPVSVLVEKETYCLRHANLSLNLSFKAEEVSTKTKLNFKVWTWDINEPIGIELPEEARFAEPLFSPLPPGVKGKCSLLHLGMLPVQRYRS